MAIPSSDFSGIVSSADQSDAICLPLKSLDVHIFIVDVSARVFLRQVYQHHGSDTLSETYYVFPVPARAAVCSFEMKTANGARLKGIVKELSQAQEDYQEARKKGWLTGLLEQFRQDVFVVSIGSMPPDTDVTVLLSYVVDMSEDDQIETVRFQLQSHVRARYGAPPNSFLDHDTTQSGPLSITVDIEMPGDIFGVTSLNHNPFNDLPAPPITACTPGPGHSRHFVRKQFVSEYFDFGEDFLLTVHAFGLGRPRCFAERLSHEENSLRSVAGPTTALALTIIPRFDLKTPPAQDYIFLIDRSLSMKGHRIEMAKQALKLLLTQLPPTQSMFNIYSFGTIVQPMWCESRQYTDASLHEATDHINNMDADMPGTKLLAALVEIFPSRRQDRPTCIFVLTDGGVDLHGGTSETIETIEYVRQAVSAAHSGAPLRIFTLGIGSGASTALCQGLATAGNGSCMMTVKDEPLAFKAKRLVNAMQAPEVRDMSVDWGAPSQVRQAPHRIPAPSTGMRLLLTAIVPGEQVPREVTLRLHLTNGTTLNYNVPVALISYHAPSSLADALGGTREIPPLIHTLSAHMLIQDVEGGDTQPPELQGSDTLSPETRRAIVKKYIVDLGTQYQIASSHTAFVAVATPKLPRKNRNNNHRDFQSKDGRDQTSQGDSTTGGSTSHDQGSRGGHTNGTQGLHSQTGAGNGSNSKTGGTSDPEERQTQSPTSRMPGAFRQSSDGEATGSRGLFDFFAHNPSPESVPVEEVICVPNPGGGSPMIFTSPHLPRYTTIIMIAGSWLKSLKSFIFSKTPAEGRRQGPFSAFPATHDQLIPGAVLNVVTLQSFDGSFSGISGELSSLVNISESRLRDVAPSMAYGGKNESVWATAIAVAYCTKALVHYIALWGDMAEKAQRFGSSVCGSDVFQNIVQEAVKLFQP